jgi:predicted O-methyltransferase YrrM
VALAPPNAVRRARGLARMRATGDPRVRHLADAISATVDHTLDDREQRVIAAIEQTRDEMLASADVIEIPVAEMSGDPADDRVFRETVKHACGRSRPPFWCLLLFQLARELRPDTCLELGTCVGISAAYQGAALELNEQGRLVTLEAVSGHVALARANFERLELGRVDARTGRFEDLLTDVSKESAPLDFVFIDGNHSEEATLQYAESIKPFLAEDAIVVFDDISYSDGMDRAWRRLVSDPDAKVAVDLGPVGLCVYRSADGPKHIFNVPLEAKPKAADRVGWAAQA